MVNLFIFWAYRKPAKFTHREELQARAQIDNMLELGLGRDDVLLATNFPWKYRGIESVLLDSSEVPPIRRQYYTGSKILGILELARRGFLSRDTLYWFHDFDVLQDVLFEHSIGDHDLSFVRIAGRNLQKQEWKLCGTHSFFFKTGAIPKMKVLGGALLNERVRAIGEEHILLKFIGNGTFVPGEDFMVSNPTFGFNFKAYFRARKSSAFLSGVDWPVKAIDFNYCPMFRDSRWMGAPISGRMKDIVRRYCNLF